MDAKQTTLDRRNDLCTCYDQVADILEKKGMLNESLVLYEKAMVLLKQSFKEQKILDQQRDLGIMISRNFESRSRIQEAKGQLNEASRSSLKGLVICEILWEERTLWENRNASGILFQLSNCCERYAHLSWEEDSPQEALVYYWKCVSLRERLAQELDTDESWYSLGISYVNVAKILGKKKLNTALKLCRKALHIFERLEKERGSLQDRKMLGACYIAITDKLIEKGSFDDASIFCEKAIETAEHLIQEQRGSRDLQDLSIGYEKKADILQRKREFDRSLALYERAIDIYTASMQEWKTVPDDEHLVLLYYKAAAATSDSEKKISYAKTGLEISKTLQEVTGRARYQTICEAFQELLGDMQG